MIEIKFQNYNNIKQGYKIKRKYFTHQNLNTE